MFSIRPAVNAMCCSSSATWSPTSSDVVSTNVMFPTVLLTVDSASDEELLCKSDEDSKVERDADTDSQSDTAVDDSAPRDTSVATESSSGLQQLGMNRFISDDVDPAVLSGDFGEVVELIAHRSLTDHGKHVLLMQHFVQSPCYKFPTCVFNGH